MMTMHVLDPRSLARALGGDVERDGQVLAPGPNHSPRDRSMSVKIDPAAPDGFVVHSFANDDPLVCKDHVRSKVGLPDWAPPEKAADSIERMSAVGRNGG